MSGPHIPELPGADHWRMLALEVLASVTDDDPTLVICEPGGARPITFHPVAGRDLLAAVVDAPPAPPGAAVGLVAAGTAWHLDRRGVPETGPRGVRCAVMVVPRPPGAMTVTALVPDGGGTVVETAGWPPAGVSGRIVDLLGRWAGLPGTDPPVGTGPLWRVVWLATLVDAHTMDTAGAVRVHPAVAGLGLSDGDIDALTREPAVLGAAGAALGRSATWARLRTGAAAGTWTAPVGPRVAGWMDDGMFAREVLAGLPDERALEHRVADRWGTGLARYVGRVLSRWRALERVAPRCRGGGGP